MSIGLGKIMGSIWKMFFGLLTCFLVWVCWMQFRKPDHHTPVHRYGWEVMSRFAYLGKEKADVVQMFEESYKGQRYENYTLFAEQFCTGKYFNVMVPGFRKSLDEVWPPDSSAINIFCFGGSTMLGAGVEDDETIPARLCAHLRAVAPSNRICVYNFGRACYQSNQERILFQQLLMRYIPTWAIWMG